MPSTATTSSGQNHVKLRKPTPVAPINTAAASSSVRSRYRCAVSPKASVNAAEPSSVPVTIAPTWTGENPSAVRYCASSTLTNPSAKPRIARPVRMRLTSPVARTVAPYPAPRERTVRAARATATSCPRPRARDLARILIKSEFVGLGPTNSLLM